MSFIDDHPDYLSYNYLSSCHFSEVPSNAWNDVMALIVEAGGPDRENLARVVQSISTVSRYGIVEASYAYQSIQDLVSKLRKKVDNGKFPLFMDCLSVLCNEGELSIDSLNEFLEEYSMGYRATRIGYASSIKWQIVKENDEESLIASLNGRALEMNEKKSKCASDSRIKGTDKKMNDGNSNIFISHRTTDKQIAEIITEFYLAVGVPNDKIFCSSLPGNDVKERISDEVKTRLKNASIIILILSDNYYESAYCLNEAGVAWYADDKEVVAIGLPEIRPANMLGFIGNDYKLRRLDSDEDIAFLLDIAKSIRINSDNISQIGLRETKKLIKKYKDFIKGYNQTIVNQVDESTKEDFDYDFGDEDEKIQLKSE